MKPTTPAQKFTSTLHCYDCNYDWTVVRSCQAILAGNGFKDFVKIHGNVQVCPRCRHPDKVVIITRGPYTMQAP